MLTFEILAVKCHNGVEVNWCRYRDIGVTDPALFLVDSKYQNTVILTGLTYTLSWKVFLK